MDSDNTYMIRATEVGAAPHKTEISFSSQFRGIEFEVYELPDPTSKMNIAVK